MGYIEYLVTEISVTRKSSNTSYQVQKDLHVLECGEGTMGSKKKIAMV